MYYKYLLPFDHCLAKKLDHFDNMTHIKRPLQSPLSSRSLCGESPDPDFTYCEDPVTYPQALVNKILARMREQQGQSTGGAGLQRFNTGPQKGRKTAHTAVVEGKFVDVHDERR